MAQNREFLFGFGWVGGWGGGSYAHDRRILQAPLSDARACRRRVWVNHAYLTEAGSGASTGGFAWFWHLKLCI